jgi:16S rRNA (adenine1518-N6/adenine1519-N6)-dimethyltransferase
VGSSVVVLAQRAERPRKELTGETSRLARQAFSQRRKTLRNTLRNEIALMDSLGIDPGKRPEELSPAQFRSLATASLKRIRPKHPG